MSDGLLEGSSTLLAKSEDVRAPTAPEAAPWLQDGGEMGQRIKVHDWAGTSLGPLPSWPQALRTIADLMIGSPQPAFVVWGADLTLLYNDSFGPILGPEHPAAFGRPFR